MRESYFTSEVSAVLDALRESSDHRDQLVEILELIEAKLDRLLDDEQSPEREWRHNVAEPLRTFANVMRVTGSPVPSVEALASELSY